MLERALERVRVEVAYRGDGKSVTHPMDLPAGTGLLYPRPDARDLAELTAEEQPSQLLLLDGTWSQAHRLYRDNPWLQALPHYRISPRRESRYLVRREPKAHCVSTLEAAIDALEIVEPGLKGADDLLRLFERMNAEQVAVREHSPRRPRTRRARARPSRAVPDALLGKSSNLIVVYAESAERETRKDPKHPELLQWVAVRADGKGLECKFLKPSKNETSERHLLRIDVSMNEVQNSGAHSPIGRVEFDQHLRSMLRPEDVLVAWNASTFKMLPAWVDATHECQLLKQTYCNVYRGKCGTLGDALARHGLTTHPLDVPGRAGQRLGNALAMTRHLAEQAEEA